MNNLSPKLMQSVIKTLLVCGLVFLSACSGMSDKFYSGKDRADGGYEVPRKKLVLPWQIWQSGRDLNGTAISNINFIKADSLFFDGKYALAKINYIKADKANSVPAETIAIRVATCDLMTANPAQGLKTLSTFYRVRKISPDQVRGQGALIMSYLYGAQNKSEQAIAWISRTLRMAPKEGESSYEVTAAAIAHLEILLRHLEQAELEKVSLQNKKILQIVQAVDAEQADRLAVRQAGAEIRIEPLMLAGAFYWQQQHILQTAGNAAGAAINQETTAEKGIAVLLPLSGRYGAFGKRVKQGVELALTDNPHVFVQYKDTLGNPAIARQLCEEVAASGRFSFIIGPLLSATSDAVADCALKNQIRMIAFTKKPLARGGAGIYQLGMTAEQQIFSLLTAIDQTLRTKKVGVIVPENDPGMRAYSNQFYQLAPQFGIAPVFSYTINTDYTDSYQKINELVKKFQPDVLLILDSLDTAARVSANLDPEQKQHLRFAGPAEWADPVKLRQLSAAIKNPIFVTPFEQLNSALSKRFVTTYQKVFEQAPDFLPAQSYDAAIVAENLIKAMRSNPGTVNWQQLINNFQLYQGLTGDISFSSGGDLNRLLRVVQYNGAEIIDLTRRSAEQFNYQGNNEQKEREQ